MAALDVIGEDFELRLAVGLGPIGQQQVLVELIGVGLLGPGRHPYLAPEHRAGTIIDDALIGLVGNARRHQMIDPGGGVQMLFTARKRYPLEGAMDPLAGIAGADFVSRQDAAERHDEIRVSRVFV